MLIKNMEFGVDKFFIKIKKLHQLNYSWTTV